MSQTEPKRIRKPTKARPVAPKRHLTAEDEDDVRAVLEVLNDPNEEFIPFEEIRKKHGLGA